MALRVFQFAATIPAGTPVTAPVTVPLEIDNWDLESLDLEVPAGPAGLMGFQIYNNGVPWIPASEVGWLVWDDIQQSWFMHDQPNASGWAVVGYNTGVYDHDVTVRMHVNPPAVAAAPASVPTVTFVSTPIEPSEPVVL